MLSSADLVAFNARGFFPQPDEAEEAFVQRAAFLDSRNKTSLIPEREQALQLCEQLFGVMPDWVEMNEEQSGLTPWQAAVLWIQETEGTPEIKIPLVQISPRLKSAWLKKWYNPKEVIAHELVHAVRLPLSCVRFEEILAYQTSRNRLHKTLGPLFRRPSEIYILLAAILSSWTALFWSAAFVFAWVPWLVCLFGFLRLYWTRYVFGKCKKVLSAVLEKKSQTLPFMLRLTDEEIGLIARLSPSEAEAYFQRQKEQHLRWQMLCAAYPFNHREV